MTTRHKQPSNQLEFEGMMFAPCSIVSNGNGQFIVTPKKPVLLLKTNELAKMFRVHPTTVRRWAQIETLLSGAKYGRAWRFTPEQVAALQKVGLERGRLAQGEDAEDSDSSLFGK